MLKMQRTNTSFCVLLVIQARHTLYNGVSPSLAHTLTHTVIDSQTPLFKKDKKVISSSAPLTGALDETSTH